MPLVRMLIGRFCDRLIRMLYVLLLENVIGGVIV